MVEDASNLSRIMGEPFDMRIVNRYFFAFSNYWERRLYLENDGVVEGVQLENLRKSAGICQEFYEGAAVAEGALGTILLATAKRSKGFKKAALAVSGIYLLSEAGQNLIKALSLARDREILASSDSVTKHSFPAA